MTRKVLNTQELRTLWLNCLLASAAFAVAWGNQPFGLAWNKSESLPPGLYLTKKITAQERINAGDGVCVPYRPPAWAEYRNYLSPGIRLCKRAAALENGSYLVKDKLLTVTTPDPGNPEMKGRVYKIIDKDSSGRPLPVIPDGEYVVPPGQLMMLSPYRTYSLDSRVLGTFSRESVSHKIWPVFTWSTPERLP